MFFLCFRSKARWENVKLVCSATLIKVNTDLLCLSAPLPFSYFVTNHISNSDPGKGKQKKIFLFLSVSLLRGQRTATTNHYSRSKPNISGNPTLEEDHRRGQCGRHIQSGTATIWSSGGRPELRPISSRIAWTSGHMIYHRCWPLRGTCLRSGENAWVPLWEHLDNNQQTLERCDTGY